MKKLLLLSLLAFVACKKTDSGPSLPGPSSTGQNYLAYKVNGIISSSFGLNSWNARTGVSYNRFADKIVISGDNDNMRNDLGIYIALPPTAVKTDTTYILSNEANRHISKYFLFKQPGTSEYITIMGSGWVRFSRVDTAVAAGTFAFTAYLNGQQGADSVVITDGRFDIPRN